MPRLSIPWICLAWLVPAAAAADEVADLEFFEAKIRPLLIERCFQCHSGEAKSLKAGLRLDDREFALRGGDSGAALVPGKPEESLLISSVRYESYEMPPEGKLTEAEIEALTHWIERGAPWPSEAAAQPKAHADGYDWSAAKEHWAWQPVQAVEPPALPSGYRAVNGIDHFVAAGLQERGLEQPDSAEPRVFVRRAFHDLLGVPPTPDQIDEWIAQLRSETGKQLRDEGVQELVRWLLDQPQYGERWGRHWLDVARYSDGGGWSQDNRTRPNAWRYRDWVVDSLNEDLPYDQFVRAQIAGDLLESQNAIGTGFFTVGPSYSSDGGDPESIAQARGETLDDLVDTFSRAFLGLTVSCARCHDHKFDPIPTQDYYSLAGIFQNSNERELPLVPAEQVTAYHEHQKRISELTTQVKELEKSQDQAKKEQLEGLKKELEEQKRTAPAKYEFAHALHDTGSGDMKVALRGNLLKPGEVAPRRFLRILAGEDREHFADGSGRRQLAEAVAASGNPLTARVIVNRLWLHHFGKALVRSPSNFGTLGQAPTHPELLDWLASRLVSSGWSLKQLHVLIMQSATYRSSSRFRQEAFDQDGDNVSLWRMNPRRMDVETWRDSLLSVTGELDFTLGGPPVNNIVESKRRTLYARVSRNSPFASDPFLRLFDFPIPRASNAKRTANVIPQQFLFMMNSHFMVDRAKALATRLAAENKPTEDRIRRAYALLYGRSPSAEEIAAANQFVEGDADTASQLDRWQQYCQVLLSSNEFMQIR